MKTTQEKFYSALDAINAAIVSKRESGYANEMEKFAGNIIEKRLADISTAEDFRAMDLNEWLLIWGFALEQKIPTSACGILAAIYDDKMQVEVF